MKATTKNLRYFLYLRRSQDAEDRQVASLEDQEKEMREIAKRLGITIVDVIQESKSAKKPGREGFNSMIQRIHSDEADAILCWKLNRLARNPIDGGQISWLLQQRIIKHIQTYSRDYRPEDNVIVMAVELGMANQFVNDLAVDVKRGMRNKAKRGWYPSSHLPAGYKHSPVKGGGGPEIVPDDVRFPLLKRLWNLLLRGASISELREKAKEIGLVTPRGNHYSRNTFYHIFANPFYMGYFDWTDESGEKQTYKGKHKAMITEEEFNKAQMLLGERGRPTRVQTNDFPLRGPIACGECGMSVTAERKLQCICTGCKSKFSIKVMKPCPKCELEVEKMKNPTIIDKTYYRCTKKHKTIKCQQKTILAEDLQEQVEQLLSSISIPQDFYEWAVEAVKQINKEQSGDNEKVITRMRKRESELNKRIEGYIRMAADGHISSVELGKLRTVAQEELRGVQMEMKQLHTRMIDWVDIAQDYLSFAKKAATVFKNGDNNTKRAILSGLGSNLNLKDKKLYVAIPKPLLGIKSVYQAGGKEYPWLETKKALEVQGLSGCDNRSCTILCAR